jgi:predicted secreted protein
MARRKKGTVVKNQFNKKRAGTLVLFIATLIGGLNTNISYTYADATEKQAADAPLTAQPEKVAAPAGPAATNLIEEEGPAVNATQSIQYEALHDKTQPPLEIQLKPGDTLNVIKRWALDPGLFEDNLITVQTLTSDGNPDKVLEENQNHKVNLGTSNTSGITVFELWSWKALRLGTAEIRFQNPDGEESLRKISVVVVDPPKTHTVDLGKALPADLTLNIGDEIIFQNSTDPNVSNPTDIKTDGGTDPLLETRPHNTFDQAARFRASHAGTGNIKVAFPSDGLATVIKTETIKVTVKATPGSTPAKKPVKIDESQNGQTIKVKQGDALDIHLTGTISTGAQWSIDNLSSDSVEKAADTEYKDLNPNVEGGKTLFILHFKATKPGKTTIKLNYGRSAPATPWSTYSVTIEVN